jgi:hypothetical protein
VLCQVSDPGCAAHLRACLDLAFAPTTAVWELGPDDNWTRSTGHEDYQQALTHLLADRGE